MKKYFVLKASCLEYLSYQREQMNIWDLLKLRVKNI